jgi:excinuclease ABC subunit A
MAAGDIPVPGTLPAVIEVRGARHNNLRDIDVDVPLWRLVAVVGVSGSGKTSLAMGTLYAEGLQRFLQALSTYSRRRLSQAQRPDVDRIEHLPPALALRQRPPVPGPRSTVGTMSEVLNVLRVMMSRLGEHRCPNGHMVPPSIAVEQEEIVCPVCGAHFVHPGAESFAFNSYGACPACQGLGVRSEVDESTLVPDPDLTIEDGAVLPWNSGGRRLSMYAAGQLGVRLDVPYKELTDREKDIVLHGEPVKRQVTLSGRNGRTVQLSVNYDNAVAAVERSLRSNNERTRRLVQRFVITRTCSVCHGTRLRPEALSSLLGGRNLAEVSALTLDELRGFVAGLPPGLPAELSRMTTGLLAELDGRLTPLLDVGLAYLTADRAGATLSTGERQRIELTSTVRASTTGMLYVLDEPSVGLHPSNVTGLLTTIAALAANGNSVVVVEHERELIRAADWVIELGPKAGAHGGTVIAQGTPGQLETDPHSIIGPFLAGAVAVGPGKSDAAAVTRDDRPRPDPGGQIVLEVGDLYNLHDVTAVFPLHRLTALAGPSGAGKTALVLDSLIPAARSPSRPTPAGGAGNPATSRSTPARDSARPASGSATSTSTSSTCPTSPSSARPATAPASTTPPWP